MKKLVSLITAVLVLSLCGVPAFAAETTTRPRTTVSLTSADYVTNTTAEVKDTGKATKAVTIACIIGAVLVVAGGITFVVLKKKKNDKENSAETDKKDNKESPDTDSKDETESVENGGDLT